MSQLTLEADQAIDARCHIFVLNDLMEHIHGRDPFDGLITREPKVR